MKAGAVPGNGCSSLVTHRSVLRFPLLGKQKRDASLSLEAKSLRWVRAVQRERAARTRGLGLRVATTTNSLSCPAQAGHPVLTKVRAKLRAPAITGSSAYADDDKCKK